MMNSNNIVIAPQVADFDTLLEVWSKSNVGGASALLKLLTTPSVERDEFLHSAGYNVTGEFNGSTYIETFYLPQ